MKKIINYIESKWMNPRISLWRTFWINFRCRPIRQALKFHIRIYGKVRLANLDGEIELENDNRLIIGKNIANYTNTQPGRISIAKNGIFRVGANVLVSQGANIVIGKNALFELGDYSTIGDNAKIICYNHIKVGKHCGLTWEIQIMDFNSHIVYIDNKETTVVDDVIINDYCWIGNRTTVMPGVRLPERTIVASNSLLNKDYLKTISPFSLIGGIPARLLREKCKREYNLRIEAEKLYEQIDLAHKKRNINS